MLKPPKLMAALAAAALLSFLLGLLSPHFLELPRAAPLHMVLALGIMPLILGAMTYFIPVLTRTGPPEPRILYAPLIALAAGIILVFSLVFSYRFYPIAAVLAAGALGIILWWSRQRAKATLGRPHPGLLWYQLALAALALGLITITTAAYWPELWQPLKRLHLHLNLLGFVGLTALGTLRVLLPTAGAFPDPQAGPWLMREWRWIVAGTLLIALGAAWQPVAADIGLLLWLVPLVNLTRGVLSAHQGKLWCLHGAAVPLALSLIGLLICLLIGALHGHGLIAAPPAVEVFIIAFLLPLVTGAATHLLPLWLFQGQATEKQQLLRDRLGYLSGVRGMVFLLAALFAQAALPFGVIIATIALGQFLFQLLRTVRSEEISISS